MASSGRDVEGEKEGLVVRLTQLGLVPSWLLSDVTS